MLLAALFLAATAFTQDPPTGKPFPDTPGNHWAFERLQLLKAAGILVGYADGQRGAWMVFRGDMAVAVELAFRGLDRNVAAWIKEADIYATHRYGDMPSGSTLEASQRLSKELERIKSFVPTETREITSLIVEFAPEIRAKGNDPADQKSHIRSVARVIQRLRVPEPGEGLRNFPDTPDNHHVYEWISELLQDGFLVEFGKARSHRMLRGGWSARPFEVCRAVILDIDKIYAALERTDINPANLRRDLANMRGLIHQFPDTVWQAGRDPDELTRHLARAEHAIRKAG
jgi:hypothetical protein